METGNRKGDNPKQESVKLQAQEQKTVPIGRRVLGLLYRA